MAFVSSSSCCRAAFSQSSSLQFRFPLVRAFCVLSVGLTNLSPSSTSIIKTGCAQSHPLLPFLRSKFNSQSSAKAIQSTRMEGNASTVPSIVVYVTVPNKEAGKKLAGSIIKEKLAACVNRVPGIRILHLGSLISPLSLVYNSQISTGISTDRLMFAFCNFQVSNLFICGRVRLMQMSLNDIPYVRQNRLIAHMIQTDSEELLIIKTRESLLEALTEHVKANHEYELPEVISMPITGGNIKYLEWIKSSTRD